MKRGKIGFLTAAIGICLSACSGDGTAAQSKEADETTQQGTETSAENGLTSSAVDTTAAVVTEESTPTDESDQIDGGSSMVNPLKKVDSSEAFKAIGLNLVLPDQKSWFSDPRYQTIDDQIAEIRFRDEISGSDASTRAGKEELGDISGVYYKFDDTKTLDWSAQLPDGTNIPIQVQVVVEGSDVHGVLASWNYNGMNYTLWEDNGWDMVETVAKAAAAIASASAE